MQAWCAGLTKLGGGEGEEWESPPSSSTLSQKASNRTYWKQLPVCVSSRMVVTSPEFVPWKRIEHAFVTHSSEKLWDTTLHLSRCYNTIIVLFATRMLRIEIFSSLRCVKRSNYVGTETSTFPRVKPHLVLEPCPGTTSTLISDGIWCVLWLKIVTCVQ